MAQYSHSKLSTFQQCKYKYKLQYIDKIKVDIPTTIEMFMGNIVHQVLEAIYSQKQKGTLLSEHEALGLFTAFWRDQWDPNILIAKQHMTAQDYQVIGEQLVAEYYQQYTPFDQRTVLGLETQDFLALEEGHNYHVRIDRLDKDETGTYYVCDYKTNNAMKTQEDADIDRQLAMYSLWVHQKHPDAKEVKLVWYMLKHGKEVISSRSAQQLQLLKKEVETLIKDIESTTSFPTNKTMLCNWCVFKQFCPAWGNEPHPDVSKNTMSQTRINTF